MWRALGHSHKVNVAWSLGLFYFGLIAQNRIKLSKSYVVISSTHFLSNTPTKKNTDPSNLI
jgi:hypothetical protein